MTHSYKHPANPQGQQETPGPAYNNRQRPEECCVILHEIVYYAVGGTSKTNTGLYEGGARGTLSLHDGLIALGGVEGNSPVFILALL